MTRVPPQVAGVVVSYRCPRETEQAVASLLVGSLQPVTISVVDHSPAGTEALHLPPRVRLLRDPTNPGFAAGVNRAAGELPPGVDLFLLNPDARVGADTLARLGRHLQEQPAVGAATVVVTRDPPETQPWFAGGRVRPWLGEIRHLTTRAESGRSDFLSGAAMWIRRQTWDQVGPLEESYFLYGEDVDWCLRARRAGWELHVLGGSEAPAVAVRHRVSETILSTPDGASRKAYYLARNTIRVLRRQGGILPLLPVAAPRLVWVGLRQPHRASWLRGLWAGLRDRGGAAP